MIGALLQPTKKNHTPHVRTLLLFPPTRAVLQCLGIWQPMDELLLLTMATTSTTTTTAPLTPNKVSLQQDDNGSIHNNTTTTTFGSRSQRRRRRRRMVQFDELSAPPTIHIIPSHESFTAQERKDTWCGSTEMAMMVHRNHREFSSEGWDWRHVKEEDEMYFDRTTHSYIHPVHFGGRLMMISETC